jgi:hypothetical protein
MRYLLFFLLLSNLIYAQLTKIEHSDLFTESDIFINKNGVRYSDMLKFKYIGQMINQDNRKKLYTEDINHEDIKQYFLKLQSRYGDFTLTKVIPEAQWGDTLRINKRTKRQVTIPDFSQLYKIQFEQLIPIDSIAAEIRNIKNVKYVSTPRIMYLCSSPNDPEYTGDYLWSFDSIQAEKAWDITKGNTNIVIGISDHFGGYGALPLHTELSTKVISTIDINAGEFGGHGIEVAGVAGATTNNSTGIASLGWNIPLILADTQAPTADERIQDLVDDEADIINISWGMFGPYNDGNDTDEIKEAIEAAINQGVIVVVAAGNNEAHGEVYCEIYPDRCGLPYVHYPAHYNFGSAGQVIAISGTIEDNGIEGYIENFNYSPGSDPINDPDSAFIDFAAPGTNIKTLSHNSSTGYKHIWSGTSVAAPFVSALAALMLSINDGLTPNDVYDILKATSEKVGSYSYDANGWNTRFGYGRVNAYEALKYTIENYGGTFNQDVTLPAGDAWNIEEGVTLTFESGNSLLVYGELNVNGTSSEKVTFDFTSPSSNSGIKFYSGSEANIEHAVIQNAVYGVRADNGSDVYVKNSEIKDNTYGIYGYYYCDLKITGNYIHDNTYGVQGAYGSTAKLYGNVIEDNSSYGIVGYYGAIFQLGLPYNWSGYNTVRENGGYEVYSFNSNTDIDMYNVSVHDDSGYEIVNSGTTSIYSLNGWFGSNGLSSSGTIVNVSPLGSQPGWEGVLDDDDSSVPKIGINPEIPDKYRGYEGVLALKDIIEDNTKSIGDISSALSDLYTVLRIDYKDNNYDEKDNFYEILVKKSADSKDRILRLQALKYMLSWKILGKNYEQAIELANKILNEFQGEDILEIQLSLVKLYILTGDKTSAEPLLNGIKSKYGLENPFITDLEFELKNYELKSWNKNKFVDQNNDFINSQSMKVSQYQLGSNYPNPFNPATNIAYTLPEKSQVIIKVFDILGREVAELVNDVKETGNYTITFNGSNLASGMYIVNMQAGESTRCIKILLMK